VINPRSEVFRKHEFQPTRVGKGATLGANSTIVCGTSLGTYAFVGAGSVVTSDVLDYALAYGNPGSSAGSAAAGKNLLLKPIGPSAGPAALSIRSRETGLSSRPAEPSREKTENRFIFIVLQNFECY